MATLSTKSGGLIFTFFLLFLLLLVDVSTGTGTETETNSKSSTLDLSSCQCGLFLLNSPTLQRLPNSNSKPVVSGLAVSANCSSKNDRESCASTCLKLVHVMAANDVKSPLVHLVAEVATRTLACQTISSISTMTANKKLMKKNFNKLSSGLKIANNIHGDEGDFMRMEQEKPKLSEAKWLGGFYRWCDSTWAYAGIFVQEPLCCLGPEAKTCPKNGSSTLKINSNNNSSKSDNGFVRNGRKSRLEEEEEEISVPTEEEEEEEEAEAQSSKGSSTVKETEVTQLDGLDNDEDQIGVQSPITTKTETESKTSNSENQSQSQSKSNSQQLKNRRSLNSTVLAEAFQFAGVFLRSLGYGHVAEGISQVLPTNKASELLERADYVGDWVWNYQDRYMSFPREFNLGYCYVEYMGFTLATEGIAATTSNIYNRIFKKRASTGSGSGTSKIQHNQRHHPNLNTNPPQLMSMSMPMPMLPISYQPLISSNSNPHLNQTKNSFNHNSIDQMTMGGHQKFFVPHPVYHFELARKARAMTVDSNSNSNPVPDTVSNSDAKSHNETKAADPNPNPSPSPIPIAENRELIKSKSPSVQVKKSGNSTKSQGKGQSQGQGQGQAKDQDQHDSALMDLATAIVQSAMGDSGGSGDNKMSTLVSNALPIVSKVAENSPMIQSMVQNLVTSFLTPSRTPARAPAPPPAPTPIKTTSGDGGYYPGQYENPYQYPTQYPSQQQQGQGQISGQVKHPGSPENFNTVSNHNNNNNNQNHNDHLSTPSSSSSKRPNRPRPSTNSNSNQNPMRKPLAPTSPDYDIEDQFTNAHDSSNSVHFPSNHDESSRPNGLASIIGSLLGGSDSDSDSGNSSLASLFGKIVQSAIKGYFGSSGGDGSKPSPSRGPYSNNKNSLKHGLGSNNDEGPDLVTMIMDLVRPFFISFFGVVPDQPGYGQLSIADRRDRQELGKDSSPYLTNDPDATTGLVDLFFGSPSLPETGSVIYDFGNRMVFAFSRANEPVHGLYCFKQYTANKAWDYFRGGVRNLLK